MENVPCHGRTFMDCHHYCKKNCRSDRVQCIYHCQNGCGCRTAFIVLNNGQCRKLSRCTIEESQEEYPFTMDKLLTTTSTTKSSGASNSNGNDGLNLNPNLPELVLEGNAKNTLGQAVKLFAPIAQHYFRGR
ncbi:uncharacterized protein Dwil_GK27691 [Drosophila willistoni]|uniref:TIL domain-containing protein n=1 Tax=Drosophila willistoni TaxID=7260 RepID=A0A0Q9WNH3_DROWI|nr:uncharacterized protein Dwil_GK27691 [Drosophila willistoni]